MKMLVCQTIQQTRQHVENDRPALCGACSTAVVQQQDVAAFQVAYQAVEHGIGIAYARVETALVPAAQLQPAMSEHGFEFRIAQACSGAKEARRLPADLAQYRLCA